MDRIATSGFWQGMPEYTDEEVELVAEFSDAQVRGENPDPEVYLARCPKYADRLRPLLETSTVLGHEFGRIKEEYPGLRAWHLIGLPARVQERGDLPR